MKGLARRKEILEELYIIEKKFNKTKQDDISIVFYLNTVLLTLMLISLLHIFD